MKHCVPYYFEVHFTSMAFLFLMLQKPLEYFKCFIKEELYLEIKKNLQTGKLLLQKRHNMQQRILTCMFAIFLTLNVQLGMYSSVYSPQICCTRPVSSWLCQSWWL